MKRTPTLTSFVTRPSTITKREADVYRHGDMNVYVQHRILELTCTVRDTTWGFLVLPKKNPDGTWNFHITTTEDDDFKPLTFKELDSYADLFETTYINFTVISDMTGIGADPDTYKAAIIEFKNARVD